MAGMLTAGVVNVFTGAPTEAGGGADWPWGRAKMSSTTAVAISSAAAAASEAPEYHQYYWLTSQENFVSTYMYFCTVIV